MDAQNLNFPPAKSPNWALPVPSFVFLKENFPTRRKAVRSALLAPAGLLVTFGRVSSAASMP